MDSHIGMAVSPAVYRAIAQEIDHFVPGSRKPGTMCKLFTTTPSESMLSSEIMSHLIHYTGQGMYR